MFEVKRCKCGAEVWSHSLSGEVKYEGNKLYIHSDGHDIPFLDFMKSLGVHEKDTITVNIERIEEK